MRSNSPTQKSKRRRRRLVKPDYHAGAGTTAGSQGKQESTATVPLDPEDIDHDRLATREFEYSDQLAIKPAANVNIGYACIAQDIRSSIPVLIGDILAIIFAWVATLAVCQLVGIGGFPGYRSLIALLVTVPIGFMFSQLYPASTLHPSIEIGRLFTSLTLIFLGLLAASILMSDRLVAAIIGRTIHFSMMVICICTLRLIVRSFLAKTVWWRQPVLILGTGDEAKNVSRWIKNQWYLGIREVEYGQSNDLFDHPTRVIVTSSAAFSANFDGDITWQYPRATFLPEIIEDYPMLLGSIADGSNATGIQQQNKLCSPIQRFYKRIIDFVVVVAFSPLWLPLFILLAVLVKATSKGPILYWQKRLGKNSKHFRAWKFRTMMANADDVLEQYLEEHPEMRAEWERDHKLKDDPRVTRIGKILRKTSLDELPQLINVLFGEMSLVGPRPIVDDEIEKYRLVYRQYERVVPGITGLWQISGRNNTTYEERVRLDDFYIRNWSIWLDLFILFRTIKTVARGEGAY